MAASRLERERGPHEAYGCAGTHHHAWTCVQYRFVDGYGADNQHAHFHASGARAAAAAASDDRVGVQRSAANFSLVWEVAPPDDDPCTAPSAVVLYRRHGGLPSPLLSAHESTNTPRCLLGGLECGHDVLGFDLS